MTPILKKLHLHASMGLAGALLIGLCEPAMLFAHTEQGYVPPAGRSRPQRTQGGGARGCPNAQPVSLQLLIPNDHTARTIAARPTFAWYLSAVPSMPLQFALTETGAAQPIFVKELPVKQAGIMQFTLPPEAAELQVGKEYRWTVSLICNPERPSQSVYARGWIDRVTPSTELKECLARATSNVQKAADYAGSGLWYDALTALLDTPASSPDLAKGEALLQSLLHQVGLNETIASKSM
ncbi:DUF928 domain-containing protein [Tumidithrix helvetica PCC 7403]|uniref:DUF928 domain-containing protein n=1 Tax=Tumidithrix helvetica TaxID=3457545 RepID=UPI003CBFFBBB